MSLSGSSARFFGAARLLATVGLWAVALSFFDASHARADAPRASLELGFTPTDRAQIVVWVERDDGLFMGTLALTHAVAVAGIGNRPGALQMNSGYRWPYGRREGVLPVWAHRRAAAPGAKQFHRVIFQNRTSEGAASRTTTLLDQSVDDYYCLSFTLDTTNRDALDAVTCASVFSSDKGRYLTDADVLAGYVEPEQTEKGFGTTRALHVESLYPPRRAAMLTDFTTEARVFTTVSPCFVATAAYGSPHAAEISVLRRVRDRYLASHGPGRRFVAAYYDVGPKLANVVRERAWLRTLSRAALWPVVALARWWSE
jgi:hypothetical protein